MSIILVKIKLLRARSGRRWGRSPLDAVTGRVRGQVQDAQFRFSGVCSTGTCLDAQGDIHKGSCLALIRKEKKWTQTKRLPTGERGGRGLHRGSW